MTRRCDEATRLSAVMCFAAAVISGTIFVAALLHEYALVEVAASV